MFFMPYVAPVRSFAVVLLTVWACSSFIGFAMAKANPLLGVIAGRVMAEVDANGDHKVTRGEFAHARGVRFSSADQNRDGYVSRDEFMAELATVAGDLGLVWGDQFFNVLDRDADNLLARDEVDQMGEVAFDAADKNGDGVVTPGEVHPSLAMAK
jgi:Ca2+-binding EF-hand superfamily protein